MPAPRPDPTRSEPTELAPSALERFSAEQQVILSMVIGDASLGATLERLAASLTSILPGMAATIHAGDTTGTELRLTGASGFGPTDRPALDHAPLGAFEGLPVEPAALRTRTLVQSRLAATVERLGYAHVLHAPVLDRRGGRLGSLALWSAEPPGPDDPALEILALAVPLVAIALERHQTTEALREREARIQSVFALHPDAVLILDAAGLVQSLNPAAEQLLAETPRDFVGQPLSRLVPAHLVARFDESLRRALTGYPQRFGTSIHPKGRDRVEVDVTFVPLVSGGDTSGVYVVAKDVTEQLAAAEQLEQHGRQLRQSAKMEAVGRLAGGIAHDFNNLLTAIRGYTDLLLDHDGMPDDARTELVEIARGVDRASALTRQLLAFSRQQVVQPRLVDFGGVVEECRGLLSRLVRADTELSIVTPPDPIPVLADPTQLHQLIINLVVNAQDAMPNGGRLVIETGPIVVPHPDAVEPLAHLEPGSYATLSVTDTGHGMDRETQAHIFEPFFTTKPPGQGTGLGLSTVYGIVEQCGGRIGFESAVDRGTRFVVYLPLRPGGPTAPDRAPAGRVPVQRGTETILLAEDDELVRRMVRRLLAAAGYAVLEARHGADALLVSREFGGPIDLLLTDVVMPELNGLRLAHILSGERPETGVIFMSGYARDEVDRRGLMEPGVVFIHKPFTASELTDAVRSTLDRRATAASGRDRPPA